MCTLTYLPKKEGFILTSSRDEVYSRPTTIPKRYTIFDQNVIFPKDEFKGGTWLVLGENRVICLLNGSEKDFEIKEHYHESRGTLVLNHFKFQNSHSFFQDESFENVAPFTMVIFSLKDEMIIQEISWNGSEKTMRFVNSAEPKIWSSTTLYSKDKREERKIWFSDFLKENRTLTKKDLLNFHQKEHTEESATNILMKRRDGKQTTSISQINVNATEKSFLYHNLLDQTTTKILWTKEEMDSPSL